MDTDREILGNTVQCLISVSDHHCPTYFQAFSRCYRTKKKCPEAIFVRTIKRFCRCFWQAHYRRERWMGENTEAFGQKYSKEINRQWVAQRKGQTFCFSHTDLGLQLKRLSLGEKAWDLSN